MKTRHSLIRRSLAALAAYCVLALAASAPAQAAISCNLPSGVSLNFGTYDDSSAGATNVSTGFSVSCCQTGGGAGVLVVALGTSLNSGQISTRQMKNAGNTDLMNYQLYYTSFGGTVWGDGVTGGSTFSQAVNIVPTCVSGVRQAVVVGSAIFGQVPALQSVSAGSYSDQVTITITP